MTTSPHPGATLRALMDDHCVMAPGAFNGLVARAVTDAGFEACYVSGGATSVAAGVPDVGVLTLDHFVGVVRQVAGGSGLPVLADADTGFGEFEMVRRTVLDYDRAGAAGLHIEDQVFPKRCGHLQGKQLVETDHMVEKIEWAAAAARDCSDGAFLVCARTDAAGVAGLDEAIERSKAYVEAGADMVFPEGLSSEEQFTTFARAMTEGGKRPYLLANMTEFGTTPVLPHSFFADAGYSIVIYPVTFLRVAMGAVQRGLASLREEGSVASQLDDMLTRDGLYHLVGYQPASPWQLPAR